MVPVVLSRGAVEATVPSICLITSIEFQDENDAFWTLWFETTNQRQGSKICRLTKKDEACYPALRHLITSARPR